MDSTPSTSCFTGGIGILLCERRLTSAWSFCACVLSRDFLTSFSLVQCRYREHRTSPEVGWRGRTSLDVYQHHHEISFPSSQPISPYSKTSTMTFQTKSSTRSFGGRLLKLTHNSSSTKGEMTLNLYLPPQASSSHKVPVLFYLAGLTCTGDNCAEKGFFQSAASEKDIAVVYPDTSPRMLLHPPPPFVSSVHRC